MEKIKFLIIMIILFSCNSEKKQILEKNDTKEENFTKNKSSLGINKEKSTKDFTNFIAEGFEIAVVQNKKKIVFGDLNQDGFEDFVAVLVSSNLNIEDNDSEEVRIAIYEGSENDRYIQKALSGNLTSAFIHNENPTLKITSPILSVSHQSMRHDYEVKFRFEKKHNNYMLIGSELNNYGNATHDGAGNTSINFLTKTKIKKLFAYDHEKEKLNDLKPVITKIEEDLISITQINDLNIYKIIGSE
ncbi:hypothetical protein ATO12_06150 [Aquimarina atlantica]|uniref:Lipoprotein n=1 Tax=Aquimarina atlantica TaxID=1317122 RepID=A0A023BP45_9FLAO|nr:hypothetical protein [Aquimarina atlantica]EZH71746.1 hypothetical protein ATO12_06150 [Aquimarina atlantica]